MVEENKTNSLKKSTYGHSGGCDFSPVSPDERFEGSQRVNRKANKHNRGVLILISSIVR